MESAITERIIKKKHRIHILLYSASLFKVGTLSVYFLFYYFLIKTKDNYLLWGSITHSVSDQLKGSVKFVVQ